MTDLRFGRKIALPSTAQIKHEMRMLAAGDLLTEALKSADGKDGSREDIGTLIGEIAKEKGISAAGTRRLMERLDPATRTP